MAGGRRARPTRTFNCPSSTPMLDRKFVVENAELVQQNCTNRGADADVGRVVELESRRKACQQQVDELNRPRQ